MKAKKQVSLKKKVLKHLKGDIKGEKKEIAEDVALAKSLKGKKSKSKKKFKNFTGYEYGV